MANIYGGQSSWLDEAEGSKKGVWGSKKNKDTSMVTQGLLSDADLKARLKGLTSEQKQVVLKEQELYRARAKIRRQERFKEFVKQSGFRDRPQGRGKITATFQFALAVTEMLTVYEKERLVKTLQEGGELSGKVKRPPYTREEEETILRMAAEGRRDKEIAQQINRPIPSVTRKRKELQTRDPEAKPVSRSPSAPTVPSPASAVASA